METSQSRIPLPVGGIISQAWDLACRHCPVFLLTFILSYLISQLPSSNLVDPETLEELIQLGDYQELGKEINRQMFNYYFGGPGAILFIVSMLLTAYINIVNYKMYLGSIDKDKPEMGRAFKTAYKPYLMYIGVSLVYGLIISLGYTLCILPGVFLTARLLFVPILAVDKPQLTFGEVFSRSWQMTEGHFFELLALGILAWLILLAGLLCCCIGVIFTAIIYGFMFAAIYRRLSPSDEVPTEVPAEDTPAALPQ